MVNYASKVKQAKVQRQTTNTTTPNGGNSPTHIDPDHLTPETIIQLQRQLGNQYVTKLLSRKSKSDSPLPNFPKIQRQPQTTIQREDEEKLGLLSNDEFKDKDFSTIDTLDESIEQDDKEETNENGDSEDWVTFDKEDDNPDDPFDGFDDSFDQKKGQNPDTTVDKHGYTGTFGKVKDRGMNTYQGYKGVDNTSKLVSDESIGTNVGKGMGYVGKQMGKGIDNTLGTKMFDDKLDGDEQDGMFTQLKNAIKKIKTAIKDAMNADGTVFGAAMEAIGTVKDVFEKIASYGIPIVSALVSVVSGAYSVYSGWTTYKAFDIASKDAKEILEANEDDTDDLEAPLLKDKSTGKSATYAAAKTWRAFLSKIFSFATSLGKGLSQVAALFTGPLAGTVALGFSLAQSAKTAMGWLKALYKINKGTKGKNRALHSNTIMEAADQGNEQALKLLLDLGLTGDMWMIKLAAKLGVEYDPTYKDYTEVLGSKWLGKQKDKVVKFGSEKATKGGSKVEEMGKDLAPYQGKIPTFLSDKIKDQFIKTDKQTALALMIEPRDTEEMLEYLQDLKTVGMYEEYAKELMGVMKSK